MLRSSTVASDLIDPVTAEQTARRVVVSVLVLKRSGAVDIPVSATVTASMQELAGMRSDISLREVRENGRVSYLGTYDFLPSKVIDFEITVLPEGAQPGNRLKLSYRARM